MTDIADDPLMRTLDIREKLAHIDQMLADHDRKRQEMRLAPWQLILAAAAATATLVGATAAVTTLIVRGL